MNYLLQVLRCGRNSSVETNRQESREYGRGEKTKESREDCQAGNSCKESRNNEAGQHINKEYFSSSSDEEVLNYTLTTRSNRLRILVVRMHASNSNGDMSENECNIDSQLRDPMDGYIGSELFLMDGKTEIIGDNWAIVKLNCISSIEHSQASWYCDAKRRKDVRCAQRITTKKE